ncbi:hypothetical protein SAY87_016024 [Trapa incisa]|uniref:Glutamine amidotransferase type-2 domain-containing protein n=1 Tax=Trapa incisa TaxID=236973 RepID=A0AAN7LBQ4_9MYRT|nr:hypothetical protein SAY87_016024 [Trapa incisa]
MCGIALIASGVHLGSSRLEPNSQHLVFSVDDLKSALQRRGPDSVGSKKLILNISSSAEEQVSDTCIESEVDHDTDNRNHCFKNFLGEMHFIGATLQLRGVEPVPQPFVDDSGNILVYNGEIFGGILIEKDCNDGETLLQYLGGCCPCSSHDFSGSCKVLEKKSSVPEVLSQIKGPWALIYWQECSKTLWFGRDALGRRSLLVHWPSQQDSRFLLSSVSPTSVDHISDIKLELGLTQLNFWEELPCGIYSIKINTTYPDVHLYGGIKKHEWSNSMLKELILWERLYVEPIEGDSRKHDMKSTFVPAGPYLSEPPKASVLHPAEIVLSALRDSVMRRTSLNTFFQGVICDGRKQHAVPVAVLFSGGLDSMILAALLEQCLDPQYEVDLLNVSFDGPSAPDRISARMGVNELRRIAPSRRWRLVEIDADLSCLNSEMKHVMSLIYPANTYMDLNIGTALWLAANGNGWVYEENEDENKVSLQRHDYKSPARIVLVGSGADEQCAGYGRHKTKYIKAGWVGLHEEMRLDMQRIWKRNLGRDDRCISDVGREARFPFLDEDVIRVLLDIPLWEIANLEQPSGMGDKKILREVARLLGLSEASILPKRAIQFGSRIARESNRKNFGSNRAANQASAGSATIYRH